MQFEEIKDKKIWNNFVLQNEHTDILQSWEWGITKKIKGWRPFRFGIVEGNKNSEEILVGAQCLVKKYKFFGNLAYLPHAPVFVTPEEKRLPTALWQKFEKGLVNWAKENNVFAIEMEPKATEDQLEKGGYSFLSKWKKTSRNRQPIYKLVIDTTQKEEDILLGMKKNTRYNIRYAKRKGVKVHSYKFNYPNIEDVVNRFYELVLKMQDRAEGYPVHSKEYFEHLVDSYKDTDLMRFFEVEFEGDVIAMNISQFTKVWACSFYAGSCRKHRKKKAPYLLRWAAIHEAKKRGCKIYDFWGIMPNSEQHKGYTRHKLSFGGKRIDFVGVLIYPINWKAKIWELAMKIQQKLAERKWN